MIPVFDGHNDTLLELVRSPERDFAARAERGHIDLPRAGEGGLAGGIFAIFSPNDPMPERTRPPKPMGPLGFAAATRSAQRMMARLFALERAGQLRVCTSVAAIREAMAADALAAVLHLEGAEAIGEDLAALEVYHRAGLRSLGIVWSRPNAFGSGVPFAFPGDPDAGPGLTAAGFELVRACNRLGVALDLSHLNARGFWDVAETSDAPLIASHSNAHALCPTPRNLTDEQLAAVRASGGLVGLNFAVAFLREDGADDPDTPLETMLRHLDHLLEHAGEDGVALGSDFDGATIPAAIGDAAGLPRLLDAMREHGYDDELIERIAHRNWLRVLAATWGEEG